MQLLFSISSLLLLLSSPPSLPDQDVCPWQDQGFSNNVDELTLAALLPKLAAPIIEASEHRIYEDRHTNQKSIFQELVVQTSHTQEAIKTCCRKSASHDNGQQKETARDSKQDPLRIQKKGVGQGLCFNSKHGCPLPQLVLQASVCSTSHYHMLKHFYVGEDEHCLTREEGRLRTTWQEEGSAGLVVEKDRANEERSLHNVEPTKMQRLWWWAALSPSQMTCPVKTLLQCSSPSQWR